MVEHLAWRCSTAVFHHEVYGMIMEEEEGSMETGEHQVLIVPRVGNDGDTVRGAGKFRSGHRSRP